MKPPIFIIENGDISAFRSCETAEKSLEAFDVENGEYIAFDSQGKQLKLKVVPESKKCLFGSTLVNQVNIDSSESTSKPEVLKSHLLSFLSHLGFLENEENEIKFSLSSIVELFLEKVGYCG